MLLYMGITAKQIDIPEVIVVSSLPRCLKTKAHFLTMGNTFFVGTGTTDIIPLQLFTADFPQELQLFLRLYSFRKCADSDFLSHIHDRADNFLRLFLEILQQKHIDFQQVKVKVLQNIQRAVAGSEIIHPDLVTGLVKTLYLVTDQGRIFV